MASFTCKVCKTNYKTKSSLNKHIRKKTCLKNIMKKMKERRIQRDNGYKCGKCNKIVKSKRNLAKHFQMYHSNFEIQYPCGHCKLLFSSLSDLDDHRTQKHKLKTEIYERSNVLRNSCRIYRYDIFMENTPVNAVLPSAQDKITEFVRFLQIEMKSFKMNLTLVAEYEKNENFNKDAIGGSSESMGPERMIMSFRSGTELILESTDIGHVVTTALYNMEANTESFNLNGSGWNLSNLLFIDIEVKILNILLILSINYINF